MYFLCDIDGTLADISHRLHLIRQQPPDWKAFFAACTEDLPIYEVIEVVKSLNSFGNHVIGISGRSDEVREETEKWLLKHGVIFDKLFMRKAGDHREDTVVKSELFNEILASLEVQQIAGVFEDRQQVVDMFRARGLRVFQVAPGKF